MLHLSVSPWTGSGKWLICLSQAEGTLTALCCCCAVACSAQSPQVTWDANRAFISHHTDLS